jgi:hypothetical protein
LRPGQLAFRAEIQRWRTTRRRRGLLKWGRCEARNSTPNSRKMSGWKHYSGGNCVVVERLVPNTKEISGSPRTGLRAHQIVEGDAARLRIKDLQELPQLTPTANHKAATTTRAAVLLGGTFHFQDKNTILLVAVYR